MKTEKLTLDSTIEDFTDEQIRKAMSHYYTIGGDSISFFAEQLIEAMYEVAVGNDNTDDCIKKLYITLHRHLQFYFELIKIALGKENES